MKRLILLMLAAAIVSLSSCYVEVDGGYYHRYPFWHHRHAGVVIYGSTHVVVRKDLHRHI